jgi:mannose PTS system EIID component
MSDLPRSVRAATVLRSFLIQASWNYESLIGTGFAFALLPVLRHLHPRDHDARQAALERHMRLFNSHPYFSCVALGAVARLEADRAEPVVIERFKAALRGSLGSLGDRLIWSAWRPACILLALVLLLAGAPWWVGVGVFLLVYNAFHFGLRVWGFQVGSRSGLEVGRVLRDVPLQAIGTRTADAGSFLCGVALVLAVLQPPLAPLHVATGLLAAATGLLLGMRSRQIVAPLLGLLWLLAILWGMFA